MACTTGFLRDSPTYERSDSARQWHGFLNGLYAHLISRPEWRIRLEQHAVTLGPLNKLRLRIEKVKFDLVDSGLNPDISRARQVGDAPDVEAVTNV